jgi:spore maturation protein SpmB
MCTFLAINTASIQLIPTTAIGLLAVAKSQNPTAIVTTAFLATCCAATSGVVSAKLLEKLPLFRLPEVPIDSIASEQRKTTAREELAVEKIEARPLTPVRRYFLALFAACFVVMFVILAFPDAANRLLASIQDIFTKSAPAANERWLVSAGPAELANRTAGVRSLFAISILAVPFLLSFFPLYAALRGVKVYEQFVEGAKEAFGVAQRIIPFLVAMLISIRMLRDAGVIDLMTRALRPVLDAIHFPVDLLPMVLMRPLSGSATQGIFVELINRPEIGPDSLLARTAGTIYGSTETTFYVLAVYFGSVAIRKTRHAVLAGLIADTVAVIASIIICRLMFT